MNWIKELKNKTWIDWIKIVVAIDIASAGIGLIIGLPLHVIAPIFGFITRVAMGIMYIFIAVLVLKRVFPTTDNTNQDEKIDVEENIDVDIKQGIKQGRHLFRRFIQWIVVVNDKIIDFIDNILDKVEGFFTKKKVQVQKEVKDLLEK